MGCRVIGWTETTAVQLDSERSRGWRAEVKARQSSRGRPRSVWNCERVGGGVVQKVRDYRRRDPDGEEPARLDRRQWAGDGRGSLCFDRPIGEPASVLAPTILPTAGVSSRRTAISRAHLSLAGRFFGPSAFGLVACPCAKAIGTCPNQGTIQTVRWKVLALVSVNGAIDVSNRWS